MGVVSVSMPEELLAEIDALVEEHDYSGRSEVVRNANRKLVAEFDDTQLEGKELVALVSMLYPYGETDIETGLTELRHDHGDTLCSNSHSCLGDDESCLETFVLEGRLDDVSTFVREAEAVDEIAHVDHSLYPLEHFDGERLDFYS